MGVAHQLFCSGLLLGAAALAAEPTPRTPPGPTAPATLLRGVPVPSGPALDVDFVLRESTDGQQVVVEGTVRRACAHRGCWMELASAQGPGLRVTFKDYAFFVPTDSAGARARLVGTLKVTTLSKEEAAHLAGEGATLQRAPDGTAREVRVVASGVELRR
jgi:hypothetical protein